MREAVNGNPTRIFKEYSINYMTFLNYAKAFLAPSKVPGVHEEPSFLEELRHKVYGGPDKETMEKSLKLLGYKETAEWVLAGLNRMGKIAEDIENVRKGLGYKPYFLPSKEKWEKRNQQ